MKLKDLKKGDFFTLKNISEPNEKQVWIKTEYDRSRKSYSCINFADMNYERIFKGNKEIFTNFTF